MIGSRISGRGAGRPASAALIAAGVVLAAMSTACGGGGGYSAPAASTPQVPDASVTSVAMAAQSGTVAQVVQKDFAITLDKTIAPTGEVTFNVQNDGPSVHEFVVFKTDAAPDALPVESNKVDEESSEVTHVDEVEDVAAGESKQLTVNLEPGRYVLICNLPAHYGLGMRAAFQVT